MLQDLPLQPSGFTSSTLRSLDHPVLLQVQGVAGSKVGSREFTPYWINCHDGTITVGSGQPGTNVAHRWTDPEPGGLARVRYEGLVI